MRRGGFAGLAFQNERQGQQTANLRAIGALPGLITQAFRRMIRACNSDRSHHSSLLAWQIHEQCSESDFRSDSWPPGESQVRAVGISVVSRQCLSRRIPDKQTPTDEIAAWEKHRNKKHAKADWQFTTADARVKPKRLYPAL